MTLFLSKTYYKSTLAGIVLIRRLLHDSQIITDNTSLSVHELPLRHGSVHDAEFAQTVVSAMSFVLAETHSVSKNAVMGKMGAP